MPMPCLGRTWFATAALFAGVFTSPFAAPAVHAQAAASTPPAPPAPAVPALRAPVITDVNSRATGATHRLYVVKPQGDAPAGGFPVVYLLDGSWYFELAVDIAAILMRSGDLPPAIIVGVGYDDPVAARRLRVRDFTTPAPAAQIPPHFTAWKAEPGGAHAFLAFLKDEVKPLISAGGGANARCQTLIGHSLGGLLAAEALVHDPGAYAAFALGDPSVWWNNSAMLQRGGEFAGKVRAMAVPPRVFIGHSTTPTVGAGIADFSRLLANASIPSLKVTSKAYDGDTHNSMIPGFLVDALRNGLQCGRRQ